MNVVRRPDDFNERAEQLLDQIRAMGKERAMDYLVARLRLSADSLLECAVAVRVLEEMGEDLSGLRIGMLHHLRLIANGQLLPEIVVRFGGKPSLISVLGSLPLPEQRRIADGGGVKLVVYAGDVQTHRMADPLAMTPDQVKQAFARGHVRSEAEQLLILDQRHTRAKTQPPKRVGDLLIDKELGGAYLGRKFIPLADLAAAVSALRL